MSSSQKKNECTGSGPMVTVILPCYNAEAYIEAAIQSTINQTYQNLEILIIEDGSSDSSLSIINEFAQVDPRIRVLCHSTNHGIVSTLNEGIRESKGEYITYMHADDTSALNRIETLLNFTSENDSTDIVAAGYWLTSENGRVSTYIAPKSTQVKSIKFNVFLITPMPHPLIFGKKKVFESLLYDKQYEYSEDFDFLSRAALQNFNLRNIKEPLYSIRLNRSRLSNRFKEEQMTNHVRTSERNIKGYFRISVEPDIHKIIVNRIDRFVNYNEILKAFQILEMLKHQFLMKEECTKTEVEEINQVVNEQNADILIQALKFYSWKNLLDFLKIAYLISKVILLRGVVKYVYQKIIWRAKLKFGS